MCLGVFVANHFPPRADPFLVLYGWVIDGNPVFVLFMIFTSNTKEHLNVLSHISQALKDQELLTIINEKNKNDNLLNRIKKIERKFRT